MENQLLRLTLFSDVGTSFIKVPYYMRVADFKKFLERKYGIKNMDYDNLNTSDTMVFSGLLDGNFVRVSRRCVKKPVIYLYPEEKIEIKVKVESRNGFSAVYPPLEEDGSWRVIGSPEGDIECFDKVSEDQNRRKVPYLFWEALGYNFDSGAKENEEEGFIVERKELISFFEKILEEIGLSSKEIAGFVTFWIPLMKKNEKYFIRFHFEDYVKEFPMSVEPTPDTIIRVLMTFRGLNDDKDEDYSIKIKEQTLPHYERKGFTVVEWGGVEL